MPEQKQFEAEARQLLHLVIHSLYSNRDIVLRELISNASDAIDKLRFASIATPELIDADTAFEIRVDTEAATSDTPARLIVSDNGIGMSEEETIANLGVIAKSGTAEFLQGLTGDEKKDSALIGQFGVGFYSSFILADEVRVLTRRARQAPDEATMWCSNGEGGYTVEPATRDEVGTTVTLDLKKDADEFATPFKLRELVRRFSDHITVPVLMPGLVSPDKDKTDEAPAWEQVNSAEALWTRPRKEVSDEDHKDFYKHVFHDFLDPLCWSHNRVEGRLEYTSLLYIPRHAPVDLYLRESNRGVRLYVQRVFIMDEAKHFLPLYLRFVKGILDSNDFPLNVSRELLQNDPKVEKVRGALTKRVLDLMARLKKKDQEAYAGFWREFGAALKEGPAEDYANREKIASLLLFSSTESSGDEQDQGLGDYAARMKEGQDKIYYLVSDSLKAARNSPQLEVFRRKGIEVLLMHDRIDEWLMGHLQEFDGKPFQDIARGKLDLGKLEDELEPEAEGEHAELLKRIKESLGEQIKEARVTRRLTDSPACLVVDEHDMGMQMRRIMEASGQKIPESKPIFEINPEHALLKKLQEESDETRFADLATILYGQASLA